MNKVKISICIPCYNYAEYVGRAIESLLEQDFQSWELIIIENGSTDNSLEVISSYEDPRIRCIQIKVNDGPVPAWKRGLEESRGEWFGLLCADDYFLPNKLQRQMEWSKENPSVSAIGTYVKQVDGEGEPYEGACWMEEQINQFFDFEDLETWEWNHRFCIPAALYRTDLCRKAGVPTAGLCGVSDWDFHVRMMRCGTVFSVIPEVLTCYRWHGTNYSGGSMERAAHEWVYSYATQYVPYLQETDREKLMARCTTKFYSYFDVWNFHFTVNVALTYAIMYPSVVAARFSDYNQFRDFTEEAKKVYNRANDSESDAKDAALSYLDYMFSDEESPDISFRCVISGAMGYYTQIRRVGKEYEDTQARAERLAFERDNLKERIAQYQSQIARYKEQAIKYKDQYHDYRSETIFRSARISKLLKSLSQAFKKRKSNRNQ